MRALRLTDVTSARKTDAAQGMPTGAHAQHIQAQGLPSLLDDGVGDSAGEDELGSMAAGDLPFIQSA
jgi:hypothetical protein